MSKGVGLHGFSGGARGGPLALFEVNKTRGDAMVLSTANHFTSSVLGLRRTCSHAAWRKSGAEAPLHTANGTDYSRNDIGVLHNITEAACASACLATPMCNAYTYGHGTLK
eukprot:gene8717-664_t